MIKEQLKQTDLFHSSDCFFWRGTSLWYGFVFELKVFTRQLQPRYTDIENLNHYADEMLKTASPSVAEAIIARVKPINESWNKLLLATNEREVCRVSHFKSEVVWNYSSNWKILFPKWFRLIKFDVFFSQRVLKDTLVELGEMDHTLDDVIGLLQQVESDMQQLDNIYGDPKFIETHLRNIEVWNSTWMNNSKLSDHHFSHDCLVWSPSVQLANRFMFLRPILYDLKNI